MGEHRTGRGPGYSLTTGDWEEIGRITDAIMANWPANRSAFEYHVRRVLAEAIVKAQTDYDAQLASEEIHVWKITEDFTSEHHIMQCSVDWCGRYRGQRRDSAREITP